MNHGQHCLPLWPAAWRLEARTWTNVDLNFWHSLQCKLTGNVWDITCAWENCIRQFYFQDVYQLSTGESELTSIWTPVVLNTWTVCERHNSFTGITRHLTMLFRGNHGGNQPWSIDPNPMPMEVGVFDNIIGEMRIRCCVIKEQD